VTNDFPFASPRIFAAASRVDQRIAAPCFVGDATEERIGDAIAVVLPRVVEQELDEVLATDLPLRAFAAQQPVGSLRFQQAPRDHLPIDEVDVLPEDVCDVVRVDRAAVRLAHVPIGLDALRRDDERVVRAAEVRLQLGPRPSDVRAEPFDVLGRPRPVVAEPMADLDLPGLRELLTVLADEPDGDPELLGLLLRAELVVRTHEELVTRGEI
jgi:hypothetical protein